MCHSGFDKIKEMRYVCKLLTAVSSQNAGRLQWKLRLASINAAYYFFGIQVLVNICLKFYLNKSFANHGILANMAEEAFVVPSQGLEGHELSAA